MKSNVVSSRLMLKPTPPLLPSYVSLCQVMTGHLGLGWDKPRIRENPDFPGSPRPNPGPGNQDPGQTRIAKGSPCPGLRNPYRIRVSGFLGGGGGLLLYGLK